MMAFLTSPLGRVILIGAALLAWTVYQREQAADRARGACQTETLQRTITEISRQRDALESALLEAEKQSERTEAELRQMEVARDEAMQTLQGHASDSCVIPADALERLRSIR